MSNVPAYITNNISLGPGIVFLGLAGTTPTQDIGAISEDGLEINLTQEFLEVFQGTPKQLAKTFKTSENMEIKITGLEWDLIDLALSLGAGVTTSTATQDTFSFGGDPDNDALAIRIQHSMPSGHTMNIYVWRVEASGEWNLTMAQDTLHTFPYSFRAVISTTSWDGAALAVNQQLFRIVRQKG